MTLVFIQLINDIPAHLWKVIRQARVFFTGDIYLVAPRREDMYSQVQSLGLKFVAEEELWETEQNKRFLSNDILNYKGWNHFWSTACQRFIILEALMQSRNLTNVMMIENDNTIYANPDDLQPALQKCFGEKLAFTEGAIDHCSGAIVYVPKFESVKVLNNHFLYRLEKGLDWCLKNTVNPGAINEMTLMADILSKHRGEFGLLPILPDEHNDNYDMLFMLFDCMSWGQYIGGTPQKPGEPHAEPKHYIGKAILDKRVTCAIGADRKPYIYKDIAQYKLFNLHIHSKEIEKYVSY